MMIFKILIIFLFLNNLNCDSECGTCPDDCEFGSLLIKKKDSCSCTCAPDPCLRKKCPPNSVCKLDPNCKIGICRTYKSTICVSKPAPKITYLDNFIKLTAGSNFSIEPIVEYNGKPNYNWTKDGNDLPDNVKTFGSILSLYNVNTDNEGGYKLIVSDEFGSDEIQFDVFITEPITKRIRTTTITTKTSVSSSSLTSTESTTNSNIIEELNTNKTESIKLFIKQNSSLLVESGLEIELVCDLMNNPNAVYWFKGDGKVLEKFPDNIKFKKESLKITKVTGSVSGKYSCTSVSKEGKSNLIVDIKVKNNKKDKNNNEPIAKLSHSIEVKLRDSLNIICSLSQTSSNQIEWSHEGTDPKQTSNVYIRDNLLTITNVLNEHEGDLSCKVRTSNGGLIEEVEKIKIIRNKPVIEADTSLIESYQGQNVLLKCIVKNDESNSILNWYNQNGDLILSNKTELMIEKMSENEAGNYTCEISNTIGTSRAQIQVKLIKKERHIRIDITPNDNIQAYTGDNFIINCLVDSNDDTEYYSIEWQNNNGQELDDNFITSGNSLLVQNLSQKDTGLYKCAVRYESGQVYHKTFYINILNKPESFPVYIRLIDSNGRVYMPNENLYYGQKFIIECVTQLNNLKELKWTKEGINRGLIRYQGEKKVVINLPALISLDLGKYVCIGESLNGDMSQNSIEIKRDPHRANLIKFQIESPTQIDDESLFNPHTSTITTTETTTTETTTTETTTTVTTTEEYSNIEDQYSNYQQNDINLSVKIPGPKQIILNEGGSIDITCNVIGTFNFTFEKHDSVYLPANSQIKQISSNSKVLKLWNVRSNDEGYYICMAYNDLAVERDYIYLYVEKDNMNPINYVQVDSTPETITTDSIMNDIQTQTEESIEDKDDEEDIGYSQNGEPVVKLYGPRDLIVKEGSSIKLKCKVNNGIYVEFGKSTNNVDSPRYTQKGNTFYLNLENLQKSDSDYYICLSSNDYGTARDYIYLTVESDEQIELGESNYNNYNYETTVRSIVTEKTTSIETNWLDVPRVQFVNEKELNKKEGDSIELSCYIKGADFYELKNYKDQESINVEKDGDYYKLKLNNLKQDDSGYYICYGVNSYGQSSDFVNLIVNRVKKVPMPSFVTTIKSNYITSTETTTISNKYDDIYDIENINENVEDVQPVKENNSSFKIDPSLSILDDEDFNDQDWEEDLRKN